MDQTGLFVKVSDSWQPGDAASLKGRKVGVVQGYAYGDGIDEMIEAKDPSFKVVSGDDALETNIKKLASGRIDTVIESPAVMNAKLKSMGMSDQIKLAGTIGEASALYIACSPALKNGQALMDKVDQVTRELRASGELKTILSRYNMTDWN